MATPRILLFAAAALSLGFWFPWNWSHPQKPAAKKPAAAVKPTHSAVSFEEQVKPILAAKCQPCHFPGGSMHARLPFDQPATIHKLGKALFTRIRDEGDRATLRAFLAQ